MNLFHCFAMSLNKLKKFGYGLFVSTLAWSGVQAVTLVHLFEFDNDLNDSLSSTVLTDNEGTINSDSYSFGANQGLFLDTALSLADNYSIGIQFSFETVSSWRKIVDFKDRSPDSGQYILSNNLFFFAPTNGGSGNIQADEFINVVFTRSSLDNLYTAYLNGSSSPEFSFVDSTSQAIAFDNSGFAQFAFFMDDSATGFGEASAGIVNEIRIWDGPLLASEISTALSEIPFLWSSPSPGNFGDGTNWVDGVAPGSGDIAHFNQTGSNYLVSFVADQTVDGLNIPNDSLTFGMDGNTLDVNNTIQLSLGVSDDANLTVNGGGTINAANLAIANLGTGQLSITEGSQMVVTNDVTVGLNGTLNLLGSGSLISELEAFTLTNLGRIQGNGILDIDSIDNFGTIAPDPVFSLDIEGDLTIKAGGKLEISIVDGIDFGQLNIMGDLTFGSGDLDILLLGETFPTLGQSFEVLTWTGVKLGDFSSIDDEFGFSGNLFFQPHFSANSLSLEVVPEPSTWALMGLGCLFLFMRFRRVS